MRMSRNMGLLSQGGGNSLTLLANNSWSPLVTSKKLYSRTTTTDAPDANFVLQGDYTNTVVAVSTDRTAYASKKYRWYQEMVALVLDTNEINLANFTRLNFEWQIGKNEFDVDIVPVSSVASMTDNYFDTGSASMLLEDIMLSAQSDTIRLLSQWKQNASTNAVITKIWLS